MPKKRGMTAKDWVDFLDTYYLDNLISRKIPEFLEIDVLEFLTVVKSFSIEVIYWLIAAIGKLIEERHSNFIGIWNGSLGTFPSLLVGVALGFITKYYEA
ncbi:hypothetical protein JW758_06370 [Candidatus Peregrinibacteria bacterium]|nr:hypothetical protein [Candidatus Peregrinibacteria bacterium]